VRTLTFWLRAESVLRVLNRFRKVAGFDRSVALPSGALTAIIPLTIVASAVSTQLGGQGHGRPHHRALAPIRRPALRPVVDLAHAADPAAEILIA